MEGCLFGLWHWLMMPTLVGIATLRAWSCLGDAQRTSSELGAIELLYGLLGGGVRLEFNKAKALGAVGDPVEHDGDVRHAANGAKDLLEVSFCGCVG